MGWGSILAKIGLGVAAPFTGGLSALAIPAVDAIANATGGAAKGSQQANQSRDQQNLTRDQLALEKYKILQGSPTQRMAQSTRASILKNYEPTTVEWGGPGSGLRGQTVHFKNALSNPNLFKGDVSAMSDDIIHQNLLNQLKHGSDLPTLSTPGQESTGQKILGGTALGSSILGGVAGAVNRAKSNAGYSDQPPKAPTDYTDIYAEPPPQFAYNDIYAEQ